MWNKEIFTSTDMLYTVAGASVLTGIVYFVTTAWGL
jgi:hypothetical protein